MTLQRVFQHGRRTTLQKIGLVRDLCANLVDCVDVNVLFKQA